MGEKPGVVEMSFESIGDFLRMGGYAGYVWSAYGITVVVLVTNVVQAWLMKRKVLMSQKRVIEREHARAENARVEQVQGEI